MNVSIPDTELVPIIECLGFLAELTRAEEPVITDALARFVGIVEVYDATDLRADLLECADYLAGALGYPDADMDPGLSRPAQASR